jgi:hypothetical protein
MAPAAFTLQEIFHVLIYVRDWVDQRAILRPKGLSPINPSGIEHATSWLVVQYLNQMRHRDIRHINCN